METKEVKKDLEFRPQPKKFTTFGNDDEEELSFNVEDITNLMHDMDSEIKSDASKVNARSMNAMMAAKFSAVDQKMEKGKVVKSCGCGGGSDDAISLF